MANQPRGTARERLLDAGCALVIEDGLDVLRRGLTSKTVAARAGYSERTFYSEFETKQDYVRSLVAHICDAPDSPVNRASFSRRVRTRLVRADSQDPLVHMRALCDENFERLRGDDRVAARVALAAIAHGDEQVATELRKHYGALTADLAATYEQVLDVWNVSMRYPLTSTSIAVIVSALTEGLVIRSYIDPISTPPSILADAVLALFPGTVDAQKSGERVETMLETFHSERSPSPTPPGSIAVDLHQKLMSAARANLRDQRGLDALSPEQLAADCDEPLTAVRRLYASPFSVLVAVCRPLRDSLVQSLEADHMFGFDARVSTERHFARLSVLLHQTPALAETLVLSGVRSSPSAARAATTLDIPGVVTATIAAGQAEGTVSSVYPPDRLAVLLSQTVALCVLDPDGGAEDVSALVASFLRG